MDRQGFTLIELVAVIVVLAAIFLVSFPSFTNMAKSDANKEYNDMVNDLCLSGKTYIYSNLDDFKETETIGSTINIAIEELISYGNVASNIVNTKTKQSINNDSLTYTVLDDYSLKCTYNEG